MTPALVTPPECQCTKCLMQFRIKHTSIKLPDGVFDVGLTCPHCGNFVHSFYDNAELRSRRAALRKIEKTQRNSRQDRKRYLRYLERFTKSFDALQRKEATLNA